MAVVLAGPALSIRADSITVDFETTPPLPTGPGTFDDIPMQVITVPGVATFSGGVVLGNPSFIASFTNQGTPPNAYGTAFIGSSTLSPVLTIDLSPTITATTVTGVLFNGLTRTADYTVNAYSGAALVQSQAFTGVAEDFDPGGFARFSLARPDITQVTIVPDSSTEFDYLLDTVRITFTPAVPEPTSLLLGILALGTLGVGMRLRRPTE
jgi:hypothetical protein